jgi:hypothetical protein
MNVLIQSSDGPLPFSSNPLKKWEGGWVVRIPTVVYSNIAPRCVIDNCKMPFGRVGGSVSCML